MLQNMLNHGFSKTSEYHIYRAMLTRCYNFSHPSSKNHGRRGILVCDKWKSSFERFLEDMGPRPSKNHCLERIDNNGNYEPRNCRWATYRDQLNNKRSNVKLRARGKVLTVSQWGYKLGIGRGIIFKRLDRGWSPEEAIFTPSKRPERKYKGL